MSTDPRVESIRLLASIDATLKALLLVMSEKRNDAPYTSNIPDHILDGPHGDPIVKAKDPRDWSGGPMSGKRFSECPAAYLDLVADRLDYFASKEEDPTKKRYNELDAKRARGWAARLRAGYVPLTPAHDPGEPSW